MAYKRARKPVGVLRVGWLGIGTRGQSVYLDQLFVLVAGFCVLVGFSVLGAFVRRSLLTNEDVSDLVKVTLREEILERDMKLREEAIKAKETPQKGIPQDEKWPWTMHVEELLDSSPKKGESPSLPDRSEVKVEISDRVKKLVEEGVKKRSSFNENILSQLGLKDPKTARDIAGKVLERAQPGCDCRRCRSLRAYAEALNKAAASGNPFETNFMSGNFDQDGSIPPVIGEHGPGKMLVTLYCGPLDGKQIWWPDPLKNKAPEDASEFEESLGIEFQESQERQIGGCVVIGSLDNQSEVYEICQNLKTEDDPKLGSYHTVQAKYVGRMGSERVSEFMKSQGIPLDSDKFRFPDKDDSGKEGGDE